MVIEGVHIFQGQGAVSGGSLMEGKGILIGVSTAIFNKDPIIVSPVSWKNHFPYLTDSPEINTIREEMKKLKNDAKTNKSLKKQVTKLNTKYKYLVKSRTREVASEKYPQLKDHFKLIKDDGKADALFIALYVKENIEKFK